MASRLHPVSIGSIGSDCRQAWLSCLQLMDEMQKRQLNPGTSECAMGGEHGPMTQPDLMMFNRFKHVLTVNHVVSRCFARQK